MSNEKPRNFYFSSENKQVRNRYSSAGITAREAVGLTNGMKSCLKVAKKKNLFRGYAQKLEEAAEILRQLLEDANRL